MQWKLWTAVGAFLWTFFAYAFNESRWQNATCVPHCFSTDCSKAACTCSPEGGELFCESCQSRMRLPNVQYNYSRKLRFGWLLNGRNQNFTYLHIRIENFENECQLDSLHVFDGDGIYSNRVVSLVGSFAKEAALQKKEFVTTSGQAFVYLHSGLACSMAGLNVSYRLDHCLNSCNGNGICNMTTGECNCFKGSGPSCKTISCNEMCAQNAGKLRKGFNDRECKCEQFHPGEAQWRVLNSDAPFGVASQAVCVVGNSAWSIGGYTFSPKRSIIVMQYHFNNNSWTMPRTIDAPLNRYGHSLVEYGGNLYMFGGLVNMRKITNDFLKLDLKTLTWKMVAVPNMYAPRPSHSVGHTAHVIGNSMLTFLGFHPLYGFVNAVQEYNFLNSTWKTVHTTGAVPRGTYGHTSVFDPITQVLYFYGGFRATSSTTGDMVDDLYLYDPAKRQWKLLPSSGFPSFLHSAAILSGIMIVLRGHARGSSNSKCGKFVIDSILTYDISCGTWSTLTIPDYLNTTLSRYGHRTVVHEKMMYLFGGFSGTLMNDVLLFKPGNCMHNRAKEECPNSQQGSKCVIYKGRCRSLEDALRQTEVEKRGSQTIETPCSYKSFGRNLNCASISDCATCTSIEGHPCRWCGDRCATDCPSHQIKKPDLCPTTINCSFFYNCHACETASPHCTWIFNEHHVYTCTEVKTPPENSVKKKSLSEIARTSGMDVSACKPCSLISTCSECTKNGCFWCATTQDCFDQNALVLSHSYGQCIQWTGNTEECSLLDCPSILTCDGCLLAGPNCGWCDDGSGTGLGRCMKGSTNGPAVLNEERNAYEVNFGLCPLASWYVTSCPACQCNGHGFCSNETAEEEPTELLKCLSCANRTTGAHCERCIEGYYGNALNGGVCTACECNGQATHCDPFHGQCYCNTKGVSGYNCDKCEQKYIGDPRNQTCFYELTVDFVFTFNLNGEDDAHITRINFVTRPPKVSSYSSRTCYKQSARCNTGPIL
ncbi:Laminin EGF and Kelch 6 and Kelch 3 domain contai ning protein [Trichuris trichiura]|uniref:Laminin EGF and Kelch 6 and Kelch 3 domain contai ning protein n=1 Tax=Trichuris trichiura TaxID=36087 RepID=A0A077ZE42_TRITR|nr:Laminin EGF and Kelch 6 and Kelch 3 domain contai ning protein [Trichuris trichiura]